MAKHSESTKQASSTGESDVPTLEKLEKQTPVSTLMKIIFALIPIIVCSMVVFRPLDNDIWFLLTHGRYVVEHGIPTIEPFTIHQGFDFIMQQWLSALILYRVYALAGELGLKLLVFLCYVISGAIFYKICYKISHKHYLKSVLLTYLYLGLLNPFMTTRPFIFTTIIILLEMYALESYFLTQKPRLIPILAILSVLQINIQAAMWPMLLVLLLPYLIDSFAFKIGPFQGSGVKKTPLWISAVAMVAAGFLNPYGLDAMLYTKNSYGVKTINNMVQEMAPTTATSLLGLIIILLTTSLCFLYIFGQSRPRVVRYILLALGTAYLSFTTIRGFLFFINCALFPLINYLDFSKLPQFDKQNTRRTLLIRKILIIAIALLVPVVAVVMSRRETDLEKGWRQFEEVLAPVIEDQKTSEVILYTGYNDGGLAEFHGVPSYIDPRAEVFLKANNHVEDVFSEYYMLQAGGIYYQDVLNKYDFTHLIVADYDLLYEYLAHDSNYVLTMENENYRLFEPQG